MRFAMIIAAGLLIGGFSYMQIQNSALEQQLQLAMSMQTQLQQQAQQNTLQRLAFERQIGDLQAQLLDASKQLSKLDAALQSAGERSDPQYEELLQQAQLEAARETAQPRRRDGISAFSDPTNADARAADIIPKLYARFVNTLGIAGTERLDVMQALIEVASQRYQMLAPLLQDELSADQAVALFGPRAIGHGLEGLLSEAQLVGLIGYDQLLRQETLREAYDRSLASYGGDISGITQEKVIDVLLDELFSEANNYAALVAEDGEILSAYKYKLAAFDRARDRLQGDLDAAQLGQLERFIETQAAGVDVILESTTDARGQISTTQMRIGVQDLPLGQL